MDSGETPPLERQLRDALIARSSLVTAESLRPAAPLTSPVPSARSRRMRRMRRMRRAWTLGTVAAALACVLASIGFLGLPGSSRDGSATAAAARVALQGVSFRVPAGWAAWQLDPGTQACVEPAGTPADMDHCWADGIAVAVLSGSTPADSLEGSALDGDDGWQAFTDCRGPDDRGPAADPVTGSRVITRATVPVAGVRAAYREWTVTCRSGHTFTSRLWWIPRATSTVTVRAFRLPADQAAADRLVSSLALR
jgi:hypothetical protein